MPMGVYARTKEHGENISKAKKGKRTSVSTEFKSGHGRLRSKESYSEPEYLKKISAENSLLWKGENVNYINVHKWLWETFGKSDICENLTCVKKSSTYDWALIHGNEYKRVRENFTRLCRKCHKRYDCNSKDFILKLK